MLYEHIEAAFDQGELRQDVLDVLNAEGFDMTMATFKSTRQRIREERRDARAASDAVNAVDLSDTTDTTDTGCRIPDTGDRVALSLQQAGLGEGSQARIHADTLPIALDATTAQRNTSTVLAPNATDTSASESAMSRPSSFGDVFVDRSKQRGRRW